MRDLVHGDRTLSSYFLPRDIMPTDVHGVIAVTVIFLYAAIAVFFASLKPKDAQQLNLPAPQGDKLLNAAVKHVQTKQGFNIYLTVKFSQEAQRIIKAGKLDYTIVSGPAAPGSEALTGLSFLIYKVICYLIFPLFIFGFGWGTAGGGAGAFMTGFGAVVLFFYIRYGPMQFDKGSVRNYTLNDLIKTPTVKLFAPDILAARVMESEIQTSLEALRDVLPSAATIPRDRAFEI